VSSVVNIDFLRRHQFFAIDLKQVFQSTVINTGAHLCLIFILKMPG